MAKQVEDCSSEVLTFISSSKVSLFSLAHLLWWIFRNPAGQRKHVGFYNSVPTFIYWWFRVACWSFQTSSFLCCSRSTGHSHVAARTDRPPAQNFGCLPLLHLHVLHRPRGVALSSPAVGRAQSPQFSRQISAHENAASAYVAMDAALAVQVFLEDVQMETIRGTLELRTFRTRLWSRNQAHFCSVLIENHFCHCDRKGNQQVMKEILKIMIW